MKPSTSSKLQRAIFKASKDIEPDGEISEALKLDISPHLDTAVEPMLKPELIKFIANLDPAYTLGTRERKLQTIGRIANPVDDRKSSTKGVVKSYSKRKLSIDEAVVLLQLRKCKLISIDIEEWERARNLLTEIGIAMYNPQYQRFSLFPHIVTEHLVIKEHLDKHNGRYVPDAKDKNLTGESTILSMSQARATVHELFDKLGKDTVIVGHGVSGDLSILDSLGIHIPADLKIIDTQSLWYSISGNKNAKSSLGYILDRFGIPTAFLHNGANDAYYTLVVCLMMASPDFRNSSVFRERNAKISPAVTTPSDDDVTNREKVIIRCGLDDKAISVKMGRSASNRNKRNPSPNNFFQPLNYNSKRFKSRIDEFLK
ncbi:hypothetical protein FOA43_001378 [Brettanomyces nanus]|uniref:Gfd2/YDR514C-like C-terminal domain-containing protein n=1 Tax=Eeniella nana TaxID=13502 RepID=A0A875RU03_EENNA|nr:uncharacterized protein FOA43_001378 [Brettanomyces nanus]QPG74057.1 hypothetical protein FOA43_001378 [Brettanomyces nanus]